MKRPWFWGVSFIVLGVVILFTVGPQVARNAHSLEFVQSHPAVLPPNLWVLGVSALATLFFVVGLSVIILPVLLKRAWFKDGLARLLQMARITRPDKVCVLDYLRPPQEVIWSFNPLRSAFLVEGSEKWVEALETLRQLGVYLVFTGQDAAHNVVIQIFSRSGTDLSAGGIPAYCDGLVRDGWVDDLMRKLLWIADNYPGLGLSFKD